MLLQGVCWGPPHCGLPPGRGWRLQIAAPAGRVEIAAPLPPRPLMGRVAAGRVFLVKVESPLLVAAAVVTKA